MTLTEAAEQFAQIQIERGLLTQEQWRRIKRDSWVVSTGVIIVALIPAALILILGLSLR